MFKLNIKNQHGAVTLLTSLMLVIATSLVVMSSGKTILQETKITSNSYRTAQADAAANAAMDYAISYFQVGGSLDQWHTADNAAGADSIVDYPFDTNIPTESSCTMPTSSAFPITLGTTGTQQTLARFSFINTPTYDDDGDGTTANIINPCDGDGQLNAAGTNMNAAMVVAQGWSDDCSAVRTITQCLTVSNGSILKGNGPEQPFISKGQVMAGGSATIVNRYTNSTIWTGEGFGTNGASIETYSRTKDTTLADDFTSDSGDLEKTRLLETDETVDTQAMSNNQNGVGVDVVTNDPNLSEISNDDFFDLFFKDLDGVADNTKAEVKTMAGGQMLPAGSDIDGLNGLIWVEGTSTTTTINGGTIGSLDNPAILIVEGDMRLVGNVTMYGVIYVIGELFVAGNVDVVGSVITEVTGDATGDLTVVFNPFSSGDDDASMMGASPVPIAGTHTIVSGSWKDW